MVEVAKGWKWDIGVFTPSAGSYQTSRTNFRRGSYRSLAHPECRVEVWLAPRSGAAHRLDNAKQHGSPLPIKSKMGDY
jgi:hypothetical protein